MTLVALEDKGVPRVVMAVLLSAKVYRKECGQL